jgi:hypothetical protein
MRAIAVLVVGMMFLIFGDKASAGTLGELAQECESLESYWRLHPPQKESGYVLPAQDSDPAICFGYIDALHTLFYLIGSFGDPSINSCYVTSDHKVEGGSQCRPSLGVCMPGGVRYNQQLAVFLAYARSHPGNWHENATNHYVLAMRAAFPCK